MSTTVVYEKDWTPKVTLTREDSGALTAVVEVEGLAPTRATTAEERRVGISSLDPPRVQVRFSKTASKMHRALIAACSRALASAVVNTDHEAADTRAVGPAGLLMLHLRVSLAVRGALRLLDEEI